MGTPISKAAIRYARAGWRVFPTKGKRPLAARGFLDATTHEGLIEQWWERWPDANVALAIPDGLLVVDIDPRNGGDPDRLRLPNTRMVRTPSGGLHLYFEVPSGYECVGHWPGEPGVDIKAPGKGYVLLPPSIDEVGTEYQWHATSIRPLPDWARDALERQPIDYAAVTEGPDRYFPWEKGSRYGLGVRQRILAEVRNAPVGTRNNTLFKATADAAGYIAGGELSDAVLQELLQAALDAGLDQEEAVPTMHSAFELGSRSPKRRPA